MLILFEFIVIWGIAVPLPIKESPHILFAPIASKTGADADLQVNVLD